MSMRILILAGWLLIPVGVGLYHAGPGQDRVQLDEVARLLGEADGKAAAGEYAEAVALYDEALKLLPPERLADGRRVRLEKAKAQMLARQLPVAHSELKTLCEELQADARADAKLLRETRSALAQSQYYMTWLMRLEGLPQDVWEPEIEAARQTYRLLAEQSASAGDAAAAKKNREDLESAVRLARMDLDELQGLPLPSQ
jgi:hypothetical protein